MTLSEVGKEFGVSCERIRHILAKAFRKMRYPKNLNAVLPNYGKYVLAAEALERLKERNEGLAERYDAAMKEIKALSQQKVLTEQMTDYLAEHKDEIHRHWRTPISFVEIPSEWISAFQKEGVRCLKDFVNLNESEIFRLAEKYNLSLSSLFKACDQLGISLNIDRTEAEQRLVYSKTIEVLGLSARLYNVLRRAGIMTVEDISLKSESELRKLRNMGAKSMDELMEILGKLDVHLRC